MTSVLFIVSVVGGSLLFMAATIHLTTLVEADVRCLPRPSFWRTPFRKTPIHLVIVSTFATFAALYLGFSKTQGIVTPFSVLLSAVLWLFLLAAAIDLRSYWLPQDLLKPLILLLLGISTCSVPGWPVTSAEALIGGFGAYAVLAAPFHLPWIFFKRASLGGGDINLAIAMGCLLGFDLFFQALVLGLIVNLCAHVSLIVFDRHAAKEPMPFGPCLVFGTMFIVTAGSLPELSLLPLFDLIESVLI